RRKDDGGGAQIARHAFAPLARLPFIRCNSNEPEMGKPIGRGGGPPFGHVSLAVDVVQRARVVASTQRCDDVSTLAEDTRIALAAGRAPNRWMQLLPRARPDVHLPIVEVFAFPIKRLVMARHSIDYEIVSRPK